ncbi:hypothetical protein P5Z58_06670, partial [Limosilactobacillus mucosae]|nr:hypothetical protein [Limosilactobacillus mucosae]
RLDNGRGSLAPVDCKSLFVFNQFHGFIMTFQGTDLSRLDINERFEIAKNEADAILPAFYSSDSND